MKDVTIKLSHHDALLLASFHKEFTPDVEGKAECESLRVAMNNYFEQMCKMSTEQFDDALAETHMNALVGKSPQFRNQ